MDRAMTGLSRSDGWCTLLCATLGLAALLLVGCGARSHQGFMPRKPLPLNSEPSYPPVANPLESINVDRIAVVAIRWPTGHHVDLRDRKELAEMYAVISTTRFFNGWVTLNGPEFICELDLLGDNSEILIRFALNTPEGELLMLSTDGAIRGVGINKEFARLVEGKKERL